MKKLCFINYLLELVISNNHKVSSLLF